MSATMKGMPETDLDAEGVIARINELAAERTALYRKAIDGWSLDDRDRLKAINAELDALWLLRRKARAGRDDASDVPVRHAA